MRLTGPPVETIKLDAEIDATDQLEFPDQHRQRGGVRHPAAAGGAGDDRLSGQRSVAVEQCAGRRPACWKSCRWMSALTLFVWSKSRIVPVRITDFSITEEAFDTGAQSDPRQGEPRHARAERRRSRLRQQGRQLIHDLPAAQGAARGEKSAPAPSACSASEAFHERSNSSVAGIAAGGRGDCSVSRQQPLSRRRRRPS